MVTGKSSLENGMKLTKADRRRFLKIVAGTTPPVIALKRIISDSYGKTPDGVPIVWTKDIYGNPDLVRTISKERYRRLTVYSEIDPNSVIQKYDGVTGLSMEQRTSDPDNLALQFLIDKDQWRVRKKLPNFVQDVPVTYKETTTDYRPHSCREGEYFDSLKGNIEIAVKTNCQDGPTPQQGNGSAWGTLSFVGYNDDSGNPYQCIITSYHIVECRTDDDMWQPDVEESSSRKVGTYRSKDESMDTVKYKVSANAEPKVTAEANQPDLDGVWTFNGLTDATSNGGTVDTTFAAVRNCSPANACMETRKNNKVEKEAVFESDVTQDGDSGGPFVDANGKLVCILYGDDGNGHNVGPVGEPVLNSVNAVLYDPSTGIE